MILSDAPVQIAELSPELTSTGFSIKTSARAFQILSSGLYANKIRAVIRELSCNAVDSHVDAGKADVPFELHLPTTLEPFFAIRDYGTGLTHEQVTSIYTTYFESTKTDSNAFIGALGLGSKSPFSYTDNFSVVAIKNGVKNIYTAYLNESGVPSVALMTTSETDEPAGVEVRFSVEKHNDFYNFRSEARHVYRYFKLRPTVTGDDTFTFADTEYNEKDIIPGVHLAKNGYNATAIMGNIAYPIELSEAKAKVGEVASLLSHPLVMHFEIGELDFQASREGLSYIPSTIDAIKNKLDALNAQLVVHVEEKVSKIKNVWLKADALRKLYSNDMFRAAVVKYCADTKFVLFDAAKNQSHYRHDIFENIAVSTKTIAKKYNIELVGAQTNPNYKSASKIDPRGVWNAAGKTTQDYIFDITVDARTTHFVIEDTKISAVERAKYHYKKNTNHYANIYVIKAADKTKPVLADKFLKTLHNPTNVTKASELDEKPRKVNTGSNAGVTAGVLHLEARDSYTSELVWRSAGTVGDYPSQTMYYIPLSGFNALLETKEFSALALQKTLSGCGISELQDIKLHGVRKGDMKAIEGLKNWINIETHLRKTLKNIVPTDIAKLGSRKLGQFGILCYYNEKIGNLVTDKDSAFKTVNGKFKDASHNNSQSVLNIDALCKAYAPKVNVLKMVDDLVSDCEQASNKYPLLKSIQEYMLDEKAVAQYINLIDASSK